MTKEEKQEIENLKLQVTGLKLALGMVLSGIGRTERYPDLVDSIRSQVAWILNEIPEAWPIDIRALAGNREEKQDDVTEGIAKVIDECLNYLDY